MDLGCDSAVKSIHCFVKVSCERVELDYSPNMMQCCVLFMGAGKSVACGDAYIHSNVQVSHGGPMVIVKSVDRALSS